MERISKYRLQDESAHTCPRCRESWPSVHYMHYRTTWANRPATEPNPHLVDLCFRCRRQVCCISSASAKGYQPPLTRRINRDAALEIVFKEEKVLEAFLREVGKIRTTLDYTDVKRIWRGITNLEFLKGPWEENANLLLAKDDKSPSQYLPLVLRIKRDWDAEAAALSESEAENQSMNRSDGGSDGACGRPVTEQTLTQHDQSKTPNQGNAQRPLLRLVEKENSGNDRESSANLRSAQRARAKRVIQLCVGDLKKAQSHLVNLLISENYPQAIHISLQPNISHWFKQFFQFDIPTGPSLFSEVHPQDVAKRRRFSDTFVREFVRCIDDAIDRLQVLGKWKWKLAECVCNQKEVQQWLEVWILPEGTKKKREEADAELDYELLDLAESDHSWSSLEVDEDGFVTRESRGDN